MPDFLPTWPPVTNSFTLFGLLLLAGLIGGWIAARTRVLPSITGYIAIGFILGPGVLGLLNEEALRDTRIFADISLGLVVFELGRWLGVESNRTRAVARRRIVFAGLRSVLGRAAARALYRQVGRAAVHPGRRDDRADRRRRADGAPVGPACAARVRRGGAKFRSEPPADRYPLWPCSAPVLRRPLRADRRHAAARA